MKMRLISLAISSLIAWQSAIANEKDTAAESFSELSLEDLLDIEITTASKTAEKIDTAPATVYLITANDIKNNGYTSLSEAIANIPGVTPIELGFFSFGGQRGFLNNFSQTLILVDGREMQNLIAAETFLSYQFATHNVKQIEVMNGPGSPLYGANAYVGVINIITKSNDKSYDGTEFHMEEGTEDTSAYSIILGKKFGDFRIGASARIFETDNWDFGDFVQDKKNFSDGFSKDQQEGNNLHSAGYLNHARAEPLSWQIRYKSVYVGQESFFMRSGKGLENVAADYANQRDYRRMRMNYIGWEKGYDGIGDFKVEYKRYKEWFWGNNYRFTQEKFDEIMKIRAEDPDSTLGPDDKLTTEEIHEYFLDTYSQENSSGSTRDVYDLQYHNRWEGDWDLIVGFTYDRLDIMGISLSSITLSPDFNETRSNENSMRRPFYLSSKRSLYLQLRKPFLEDKLHVTLGARRDDHSQYGSVNTFRSGFVYQVADKTYLKALYGQAFREPNIFEKGAQVDPSIPPNTSLQPAEIDNYELSVHHSFNEYMKGNMTIFKSDATNQIVPEFTTKFTNSSDSFTINGLEAMLYYKYGAWFGDVAYTFIDPDASMVGEKKVDNLNIYPHRLSFGVNYNFTPHIRLNNRTNFFSKLTAEHGNPALTETFDIDRTFVSNFTLSFHDYMYNDLSMNAQLSIKNAFDEEYFQPNVRNGGPKQFMQPGRQFMFRVILKY